MIYTTIPFELIFQGIDDLAAPKELEYRGQKVLVSPLPEPGEYRLVQLISTDPALFLHPDFQPGTVIQFPAWRADIK